MSRPIFDLVGKFPKPKCPEENHIGVPSVAEMSNVGFMVIGVY